jgi:plasmid maintenance system killer protein
LEIIGLASTPSVGTIYINDFRVNDQWRICFRWHGEDAHDVEIVDYH